MDCNSISEKLYDYLNNELDDASKKLIGEHLHSCDSCMKEMKILLSIKSEFKKNIQSPCPLVLYKIKKETKTNTLIDFILLHKKIFGFSATFAFIIAGMIFFNTIFNKNQNNLDEFIYDAYSISIDENSVNTILSFLNNE